ncbi:MAG TPA: DinB family protein [Blastocatellia bacterium]|nr:DinB family protein [Blastocatellia bacterium]
MNEIANIVDEATKAYEGNAWHGPALKELLSDVSAAQAAAKPLPAAHSIWEIVLHIAGWQGVASQRLKGESVAEPMFGDWPAVTDKSPESWEKALTRLGSAQDELITQISRLSESALQETAAGTDYSVYFMLHGVIQHTLYHAGQIALLKRA